MQFFIDTAEIEEIKEAYSWGIIDGVTTNPSLVAKSGKDQVSVLKEICQIVNGPISAEVIATDYEGMIKEGQQLAKVHKNIVIKVPLTVDGIKATKWFKENNIKTNVTLCFSANQALLAAKNGATYVSPFVGRIDDISYDGMDLVEDIRIIFNNYNFETKILTASIRNVGQVKEAALIGSDVATIPFKVLKALFNHPLTDMGIELFLADHKKANL